jgi:epidermal growth factor receptor kinase substrate 8
MAGSVSPTYILEHLATFTVSPENDLVYPADGMRRLLAMEKTNGIWTQKMLMKIDLNMINIMDNENKEVVEKFPLGLVREPTAFTSSDPKEMYNNILIYIVGHPPTESPIPAEMHIFQCVNVRAREIVEDLKACMGGKRLGSLPHRPGVRNRDESDFGEIKMSDLVSPYEDADSERAVGTHMMQANLDADETR